MRHLILVLSLVPAISSCMSQGGADPFGGSPSGPAVIKSGPTGDVPSLVVADDRNSAPAVVEVDLRAAPATKEYLPGRQTAVWAYNGSTPGPVIEARRGDQIIVHFQNDLPEPTTIHWHGLRVPNDMDGAGTQTHSIGPGASFDYSFVALDRGLYWYHPHVRSSSQVAMGLYGAIIIRDPAEPDLGAATERTLVLSDVLIDPATGAIDDQPDERGMMMGQEGNLVVVDGGPSGGTLQVTRGARTRLRLLNAATARFFDLRLEGGTMTQVGSDGGLLSAPRPLDRVLLVPGQRVDVVMEMAGPGSLTAVPYERAHGMGGGEAIDLVRFVTSDAPTAVPPALPATLRSLDVLDAPATVQVVTLNERMAHHQWLFTIDNQVYPNVPPVQASVGTRQLWAVQNRGTMDHPFHLHGFSFQPLGDPEWRDTINVPAGTTTNLVVDFADRPGASGDWMYHCHILAHAENGMMAEVQLR